MVTRVFAFPARADAGTLAAFLLPYLLAVTFLALAVASLFSRRETAIAALFFTSLPALFLAGFSWPPEAMPSWLRGLASLIPSSSGIAGVLRLQTSGAPLAAVRHEWLTLWALAAAVPAAGLVARRPGRQLDHGRVVERCPQSGCLSGGASWVGRVHRGPACRRAGRLKAGIWNRKDPPGTEHGACGDLEPDKASDVGHPTTCSMRTQWGAFFGGPRGASSARGWRTYWIPTLVLGTLLLPKGGASARMTREP